MFLSKYIRVSGSNSHRELSWFTSSKDDVNVIKGWKGMDPNKCEGILDEHILHVACGNYVTSITTNRHNVYSCGQSTEIMRHHRNLEGRSIVRTAIESMFVCLSNDGRAYLPATSNGAYSSDEHVPFKAVAIQERIIDAVTQNAHTLYLTDTGAVYIAGRATNGNFGDAQPKSDVFEPVRIPFLMDHFVVAISACYDNTICVTHRGEVYATGCNSFGHLNIGHENNISQFQKCFQSVEVPIEQVFSGYFHNVVKDVQGTYYCVGETFGSIAKLKTLLPENVAHYANMVTDVACGSEYTIFICDKTTLLVKGRNESCQLGIESDNSPLKDFAIVKDAFPEFHDLLNTGRWVLKAAVSRAHSIMYLTPNKGRLIDLAFPRLGTLRSHQKLTDIEFCTFH